MIPLGIEVSIWAALPLMSGRHHGRSALSSVAGNKALTTPDTILALLAGQHVPTTVQAATPHLNITVGPWTQKRHQSIHLAFGAVRFVDAQSMMRKVQESYHLTPSVHQSTFDHYASQ